MVDDRRTIVWDHDTQIVFKSATAAKKFIDKLDIEARKLMEPKKLDVIDTLLDRDMIDFTDVLRAHKNQLLSCPSEHDWLTHQHCKSCKTVRKRKMRTAQNLIDFIVFVNEFYEVSDNDDDDG